MQRTAGPWGVRPGLMSWRVMGKAGEVVAKVRKRCPHDAKLISASPELFKALSSYVRTDYAGMRENSPKYVQALMALAKAEGKV